jgi:hypothetical protein
VYFKRRVYIKALHELGKFIDPQLPAYPDWWEQFAAAVPTRNRRRGKPR